MIRCSARTLQMARNRVCVYKGYGVYEKDSHILHRELTQHLEKASNIITYITPEEINEGILQGDVALLAVGGGFDLGLIKALGPDGIGHIKQFVHAGGSYLGICSGAYFACDYIEFDKGGPLEVTGERFLKFYPGVSLGPLYKPYVYNSNKGAVTALVSYQLDDEVTNFQNSTHETSNALSETSRGDAHHPCTEETVTCMYNNLKTEDRESQGNICNDSQVAGNGTCCGNNIKDVGNTGLRTVRKQDGMGNDSEDSLNKPEREPEHEQIKIFFNGGGYFLQESMQDFLESQKFLTAMNYNATQERVPKCIGPGYKKIMAASNMLGQDGESLKRVSILSRYLDMPCQFIAMVKCRVGEGVAILSGGHFEYNENDIEDEDNEMGDMIKDLKESKPQRAKMFRSILKQLNMSVDTHSKM